MNNIKWETMQHPTHDILLHTGTQKGTDNLMTYMIQLETIDKDTTTAAIDALYLFRESLFTEEI
jgi:hypothetical protein